MKKAITLTAAVFYTLLLFSQGINKRFASEGLATLNRGVISYEKFHILYGGVYDVNYPGQGLKTYLIKVDEFGNFIDSAYIVKPQRVKLYPEKSQALKNADGSFLLSGASSATDGVVRMILIKADTSLQVHFTREYEWAGNLIFIGVGIAAANNGYLITGRVQLANYDTEVFLLKTDSAGNEEWRQSYGTNTLWDFGYNVLTLPTGNILLSGYSERLDANSNGGNVHARTYLIETDSLGNLVWEWRDPDTSTTGALAFIQTNDGGFVGVGNYVTYRSKPLGFRMKNYIVKFDGNKQKVWQKLYGPQLNPVSFNDVVELGNGDLLVCGKTVVDTSIERWNTVSCIMRLTSTGDTVWCRYYKGVDSSPQCCGENTLYDLEVLPDGSIVATGQADDNTGVNGSPKQQGWLLHIDSNGCLLPGSCGVTAVEEVPLSFGDGLGVRLYPNPTQNTLNIQLPNFNYIPEIIQILNINGQVLFQQSISNNEMEIDVTTLPQGLYVLQVINEERMVEFKKFVKN